MVGKPISGLLQLLEYFHAPVTNTILNGPCKVDSFALVNGIYAEKPWAMKMWDASSKVQAGLLAGNLNSLGNYDECVDVTNVATSSGNFSGQYCLGAFKIMNDTLDDLVGKMLKQILQEEEQINFGLGAILPKGLRWGFCIPSSCSSEDLQTALSEYVGTGLGIEVSVTPSDCTFTENMPFSTGDWVSITILALLFITVILSTGYQVVKVYLQKMSFLDISRTRPLRDSSESSVSIPPPQHDLQDVNPVLEKMKRPTSHKLSKVNNPQLGDSSNCMSNNTGATVVSQESNKQSVLKSMDSSITPSSNETSSSCELLPGEITAPADGNQNDDTLNISRQHSTNEEHQVLLQEIHETVEDISRERMPLAVTQEWVAATSQPEMSASVQKRTTEDSDKDISQMNKTAPSTYSEKSVIFKNDGTEVMLKQNEQTTVQNNIFHNVENYLENQRDIWTSFSLITNGIKLFSLERSAISLPSLDGLKVLSLFWVMLGHAYFITESVPSINYLGITKHGLDGLTTLLLNTQLTANSFLVCTGVLISYNFLNEMDNRGIYPRQNSASSKVPWSFMCRYIPLCYLHRYVRLTPSLALLMLLQGSLIHRLGSGPFWGSGSNYLIRVCSENWWSSLLYVQNFMDVDKTCLAHTWYQMVDMQLYVLSPLVLLFLAFWHRKHPFLTAASLILASTICTFFINFYLNLPAGFLRGDTSHWTLKMKYDYTATYTRFAPWITGMTVGYMLYGRDANEVTLNIRKSVVVLSWIFTTISMLSSVFMLAAFREVDKTRNALLASLYSSLASTAWSLAIGWIIFACETNHGGIVRSLLSMKIFQPLSRLSYCTYLTHLPLMLFHALSIRGLAAVDETSGISIFFGDVLLSFVLAVPLSLMVEMPFIRLFKTFTAGLPDPETYSPIRPTQR